MIDTAGDFINEGTVQTDGDFVLRAHDVASNQTAAGVILATGALDIQATGGIQVGTQGTLSAADGMVLAAGAGLTNQGQLQAGSTLAYSGGTFNNQGKVAAETVALDAALNNSGNLYG